MAYLNLTRVDVVMLVGHNRPGVEAITLQLLDKIVTPKRPFALKSTDAAPQLMVVHNHKSDDENAPKLGKLRQKVKKNLLLFEKTTSAEEDKEDQFEVWPSCVGEIRAGLFAELIHNLECYVFDKNKETAFVDMLDGLKRQLQEKVHRLVLPQVQRLQLYAGAFSRIIPPNPTTYFSHAAKVRDQMYSSRHVQQNVKLQSKNWTPREQSLIQYLDEKSSMTPEFDSVVVCFL